MRKQLSPWLARRERVIWAKLSVCLGIIEDNHKSDGYCDRSAKPARTQLVQTEAIEISRQRLRVLVVAPLRGIGSGSARY
ncbi:hypothetical protein B9Z51_14550 [Limnohabitans sp. T6-5]|uniref:hypothetical protein n=1 Tax=Limnohabitans sp. T6-5 TaxID=1100724 RepID=UPI000D3A0F99|nr:hypothetical protein [Limnohabitans sp. T6-5]PUE07095.1 hypothetical protein B9Z51_14550 [Limnohabitans sp. T6-5]